MTRRLVAVDLPPGDRFVDTIRSVWDAGDACLPIDQRLGDAQRAALLERMRPHELISPDGASALSAPVEVGPDDAVVVATSGSTGQPKGVVLTHDAVRASAISTSKQIGAGPDDHWLACLPLAHIGGLSVVLRALVIGTGLTVLERFEPGRVAAAAAAGANLVSLVSTALGRIDPTIFDTIVLGGARPPDRLPPNVVTTYGMTETGSGIVYDGQPIGDAEVKSVDGELWVRGPMLFRCYRGGEPFESAPFTDGGWFATGDIGSVAADGAVTVDGRRGDLIITGGYNVWPQPVEDAIAALESVVDVIVVGHDDDEWGQVVTAHVVTRGDDPVELDELRDAVKAVLPTYCAPKRLVVRDSLPRTALGKPQRHLLRAD